MKIVRLAIFNMKKHKKESISMIILMMISMLLLGGAATSLKSISGLYANVMEKFHGIRNVIEVNEDYYYPMYDDFFLNDERIVRYANVECLQTADTKYLDKNGEESAIYMHIMNEENVEKLEDFVIDTTLSEEEIANLSHPVYVPYYVKDSMELSEGETFQLIYNGKIYPFEIAGFFEACHYFDGNMGIKLVVTEEDYLNLSKVIDRSRLLAFDTAGNEQEEEIIAELMKYVEDNTNSEEILHIRGIPYSEAEGLSGGYIKVLLYCMITMAAVVILSTLFMVRYRITNDIHEQVVSIGVLEALGYRSREISISYVLEYFLLSLCGIALGAIGSGVLSPFLFRVGEIMSGHHGQMSFQIGLNVAIIGMLLFFVVLIAFIKSQSVKKFPPVVAFRKGIETHHFGKNRLPLEKTKSNVHLRLALKGFFSNTKQNISIGACIAISTVAIVISFVLFAFCSDVYNTFNAVCGLDIADLRVNINPNADLYEIRDDLLNYEEVRKVNITDNWFVEKLQYQDTPIFPIVYDDYEDTESIFTCEGRFPKHDNEVMITKINSALEGLTVGDTINIKAGKIEKSYIVCGIVTSMTNSGQNVYFTTEGMKRIKPSYRHSVLEVFVTEGVDYHEFADQITKEYGKTIADALEDETEVVDSEEKLEVYAQKKMASLLSSYNISYVEYAIHVGDKVLTGNSGIFMIESITSLKDITVTQIGNVLKSFSIGTGIFMFVSILVIIIIIIMIMEASVRRQHRELGIYKGMGYTSKELIMQLSLKIMPIVVIGTIIGTVLAMILIRIFEMVSGPLSMNIPGVVVVDLFVIIISYLAAYCGARKIKNISVYELMME